MRKSRIILAKTKADASGRMGNANVDFIYKQYDVAGVEAYRNIFKKTSISLRIHLIYQMRTLAVCSQVRR
ncbi:hypothetical protein JPSP8_15680 [Staphylococcus pseudintermedius]